MASIAVSHIPPAAQLRCGTVEPWPPPSPADTMGTVVDALLSNPAPYLAGGCRSVR